jgi:hypothetical protein
VSFIWLEASIANSLLYVSFEDTKVYGPLTRILMMLLLKHNTELIWKTAEALELRASHLLYCASRDGFSNHIFHEKVHDACFLLIV